MASAHVLAHVLDLGGGGNGAGYRRVADDKLQQEVRPGCATAFLVGPFGQWRVTALEVLDQAAAIVRPIGDHADAPFFCQWQ